MTDFLREAETDLAELAGLPGAIRDKVKAGVTELKRLRNAIDAEIAHLTGGAKATLESLQALAPTEAEHDAAQTEVALPGDPPAPPAPAPEDEKPALAF